MAEKNEVPEPTSKEYQLELLVKAESWERAIDILAYVLRVKKRQKTNIREINGFYIVRVTLKEEKLSNEFYHKIKESDELAIISDERSRVYALEIMNSIYEVETQLRRLLLHVSDLVEAFVALVEENSQYTKSFAKDEAIISTKHLEPITSHLTLGEMITILNADLSWTGRNLTIENLQQLLEGTKNIQELLAKLQAKSKPLLVWDLVASNVLEEKVKWGDITSALAVLKGYRDNGAHFKVVTEADYKDALKKAAHVKSKITKQKQLTSDEKDELKAHTSSLVESLRDVPLWTEQINAAAAAFKTSTPALTTALSLNQELAKQIAMSRVPAIGTQRLFRPSLINGGLASYFLRMNQLNNWGDTYRSFLSSPSDSSPTPEGGNPNVDETKDKP